MSDIPKPGIRVAAITGSVRPGNYTSMALALVVDELARRSSIEVASLDPAELDLPFPGQPKVSPGADRLRAAVAEATGVVLATPEYHGSFSSVIKLVIENLGFPSALLGKPVALLGVAGGQIGAIKSLEQLRGVCSHVGALVLPGSVSVANVRSAFGADGRCLDDKVEARVRGVATSLLDYVHGHVCPKLTLERMVRGEAA
jgi:chromate reductase, NAD(P)H dehydrogenase (quinone)